MQSIRFYQEARSRFCVTREKGWEPAGWVGTPGSPKAHLSLSAEKRTARPRIKRSCCLSLLSGSQPHWLVLARTQQVP